MTVNKILLTTDFSECSKHAFAPASAMADLPSAVAAPGASPQHWQEAESCVKKDLGELIESELENLDAKDEPAIGAPAGGIVSNASAAGADLIVMSTHGRTGLSHALLGSVAERVVRTAPYSVLTIRSNA